MTMGARTKIEWCDHTFSPWRGCEKVSAACRSCYAETWAKRTGRGIWGKDAGRELGSDAYWAQPLKWNEEARKARTRRRVFCSALSDVFEAREDLDPWRARLWETIERTPWLEYLLLTKRPEEIESRIPPSWLENPRPNVRYGTTAENQEWAERRIPPLLRVPTALAPFVSVEPILGPVRFDRLVFDGWTGSVLLVDPIMNKPPVQNVLGWIIVGGESGHQARPLELRWIHHLSVQAALAGTAFFVKQLGTAWAKARRMPGATKAWDRKGGLMKEWPEDLRIRQFPSSSR